MQKRVRGQRISRAELIAESRAVLAEAGVGNNSRARFLSEVSGLVVKSDNPSFIQLQPTISQHDSDAWLRAYELVFRFLRENGLKETLGAVENEFAQGPLPRVLTDNKDTGYQRDFDSLLACIPKKLPFKQKVRDWMREMRNAKTNKPAPPVPEVPEPEEPIKPAQKKPLKRRKKSPKRRVKSRMDDSKQKQSPVSPRMSPSREDAPGSFMQLEPFDARKPPPRESPKTSPNRSLQRSTNASATRSKRATPNASPMSPGFIRVEDPEPPKPARRNLSKKIVMTPKRDSDDLQDDFVIDLVIPGGSK